MTDYSSGPPDGDAVREAEESYQKEMATATPLELEYTQLLSTKTDKQWSVLGWEDSVLDEDIAVLIDADKNEEQVQLSLVPEDHNREIRTIYLNFNSALALIAGLAAAIEWSHKGD